MTSERVLICVKMIEKMTTAAPANGGRGKNGCGEVGVAIDA